MTLNPLRRAIYNVVKQKEIKKMAQSKEIIDLKRKLKDTADQLKKGTCSSQTNIDKMAYPAVVLNETASEDDNVFHKDEVLNISVGIRTNEGNVNKVTPIPEEPVAIFYADGSQEWKLTDKNGIVQLRKPRPVGKMAFDVPNILLYSKGASFYIVE